MSVVTYPARRNILPLHRAALISAQRFTCAYCGRSSDSYTRGPDDIPWHIDHHIPVCHGGTNDPENLTLSCARCNLRKGGALPVGTWQRGVPPATVSPENHPPSLRRGLGRRDIGQETRDRIWRCAWFMQERLGGLPPAARDVAAECDISRSTLQHHIPILEAAGILVRVEMYHNGALQVLKSPPDAVAP